MSELETKIKQIICKKLGVPEDKATKVTPQSRFVEDLGADSLDEVEVMMAFEDAFDIEIPDKDAREIKTIQNAFDYLNEKLK